MGRSGGRLRRRSTISVGAGPASPVVRLSGGRPLQKWISLAEVILANLAWIDDLDIEGWLLATVVAIGIGAAIWLLAGPFWMVLATSLYLGFLVIVKVAVVRADRRRSRARERA